jgi:hypothetical protein
VDGAESLADDIGWQERTEIVETCGHLKAAA